MLYILSRLIYNVSKKGGEEKGKRQERSRSVRALGRSEGSCAPLLGVAWAQPRESSPRRRAKSIPGATALSSCLIRPWQARMADIGSIMPV